MNKSNWKKIIVYTQCYDQVEFNLRAFSAARLFRSYAKQAPMYFARCTGAVGCRFEITVDTELTPKVIKAYFKRCPDVKVESIEVEPLSSGSMVHAKAFELALHLHGTGDEITSDVIHWLCNMCGYNYIQEAHLTATHTARICQIIKG